MKYTHNLLFYFCCSLNLQTFLTSEKCFQSLSLRGIIRVWCYNEMPRILHFLTRQGYVNTGFVNDMPRPLPFSPNFSGRGSSVVVVGAGPAGLAAAFHLRNFGYKVCLSEEVTASKINMLGFLRFSCKVFWGTTLCR